MEDKISYTVKEVAHMLGVAEVTVRREIERGNLPHIRIGRAVRITATALTYSTQAACAHPTGHSHRATCNVPPPPWKANHSAPDFLPPTNGSPAPTPK